jgi:hypothetical protein
VCKENQSHFSQSRVGTDKRAENVTRATPPPLSGTAADVLPLEESSDVRDIVKTQHLTRSRDEKSEMCLLRTGRTQLLPTQAGTLHHRHTLKLISCRRAHACLSLFDIGCMPVAQQSLVRCHSDTLRNVSCRCSCGTCPLNMLCKDPASCDRSLGGSCSRSRRYPMAG